MENFGYLSDQWEIFGKLYDDFVDEAKGAAMMRCNDRRGYNKWYKERTFKLCLEFHRELMKKDEEDKVKR